MLPVDLGQSSSWFQFLLTAGCGIACFFLFILPMFKEFLTQSVQGKINLPKPIINTNPAKPLKRRNVDRSSDTPPPAGFAEHLRIIEATAPNADAAVWWEYAKSEMTEAEVAIAEARLARKLPPEKPV